MARGEAPISHRASKEEALQELGEWASRYEMIAAMGYLAALLMVGKGLNNLGKMAKFRFTPPPAVISGFLGLALYDITGACSKLLQVELESTLRSIEVNIVNFVFTALILGFTSGTKKTKMTYRRIFGLIWHEGMPMLLYAQALIWGNSCFALAICGIYRLWNKDISAYEGGLVTLGLEAGRDILPSRVKFKEESLAVVHLADSAGLFVSIIVGVLLVAFRRVSPNKKQEWFGVGNLRLTSKEGPMTSREHFSRDVGGAGHGLEMLSLPSPRAAAAATTATDPVTADPAPASSTTSPSSIHGLMSRNYYSAGSLSVLAEPPAASGGLRPPSAQGAELGAASDEEKHGAGEEGKRGGRRPGEKEEDEEGEEDEAVEIEEGVAVASTTARGGGGVTYRAGSTGGGGAAGSGQAKATTPRGKGKQWTVGGGLTQRSAAAAAGAAAGSGMGMPPGPPLLQHASTGPGRRGGSTVGSAVWGEEAALGSHIALVALSVFLGYLLNLSLKYLEINHQFLRNHHLISGIRLFKICMVAAVVCMTTVRSLSNVRFKPDWFHRLAGFSLDLMATAALSSIRFDYYKKVGNLELVVITILGCVLWNLLAFFTFAKRMFPNFWYARGVTLMGDALGHSWVGLLLARAIDPALQTPVPLAFTYKLLVFFVPGSGGKNNIVISLIDGVGLWPTFLVCLFMLWMWMKIFDRYYKRRWPRQPGGGGGGRGKGDRYGDRRRTDTGDEAELELLHVGGGGPEGLGRGGAGGGAMGMEAGLPRRGGDAEAGMGLGLGGGGRSMPRLSEPSVVLSKQQIRKLVGTLPERDGIRNWVKVFCMARDGASLGTLMYKVMSQRKFSSFLVVIEDSWGYIFGGYVSVPFQNASGYYGTGECFVFKFHPEFTVYHWTGKNDYFLLSNAQHFAMGGGGGGFAFQLDDELDTGVSGPSDTYGNTRLSSRHVFKCLSIEIWGFDSGLGVAI